MKLKTIQSEKVLQTLLFGKEYRARKTTFYKLVKPYKTMIDYYKWKNVKAPIFACVVGKPCEFMGCSTKGSYILSLEVPDNVVQLQAYYNWTDTAYFLNKPNEWNEDMELSEFIEKTFNGLGLNDETMAVQATLPYIRPEWLKAFEPFKESFNKFIGSGGKEILT